MSEHLIPIAAFSQPIEAHLAKTRLESEGIQCFIEDENTVSVNWLYSTAVGGVKLKVRESDALRGREILQQEPIAAAPIENGIDEADEKRCCPHCDSTDVYCERFSRRLVFASWVLLGIPLPFLNRKWKCMSCGYGWKGE